MLHVDWMNIIVHHIQLHIRLLTTPYTMMLFITHDTTYPVSLHPKPFVLGCPKLLLNMAWSVVPVKPHLQDAFHLMVTLL
jgi:hypothetical protein